MSTNLTHDTPALRSSLEPFGSERFEHLMRRITVELTRPGKNTTRGLPRTPPLPSTSGRSDVVRSPQSRAAPVPPAETEVGGDGRI
jgi:hypothetical protein